MLDSFVGFITDPVVVMILLPIISLSLVSSLFSPGIGIGGIVGSILLLVFFIGHSLAGFANFWTIILFVIGVSFVFLELLVPGMVVGFIGLIAIVGSILYSGADFIWTAYAIVVAILAAIIGMVVLVKIFGKKMSVLSRMVLSDATDTESGYVSNVNRTELLEKEATTVTALRPSGVAMLEGERLDVVSEGSFIDADKVVVIIKVEGSRIVVREKK
ncbi:NfeD family protein [Kurthia sibirica]|uniref:Uncharacterized protein n=1 Tax=Kurthia sibirica TaxID=202750 RepID=A0A2U3AK39_9BACL|nr:NfeD family protein [Kurthia sibirica]PWI24871.1 hypothetical protein DEX24_11465 [Kurthia sibirica]GEK35216.1 hypothetical protein KSI01_27490 [Kurthia sibirica]